MSAPTIHTRFEGGWCDNCRTAWSFIPRDGMCPSCRTIPLVSATITVDVHGAKSEREDRHGDHWTANTNDVWTRVEAPYETRTLRSLQRDYGPLVDGHTDRCIRTRES